MESYRFIQVFRFSSDFVDEAEMCIEKPSHVLAASLGVIKPSPNNRTRISFVRTENVRNEEIGVVQRDSVSDTRHHDLETFEAND